MAARSGLRAGSALTIGVGGNELSKAIALLRSVGGRMYLPGLTSRVASDGSGGSPVAGDVIGWLPDRVTGGLGPELVTGGWGASAGVSISGEGNTARLQFNAAAAGTSSANTGALSVLQAGRQYRCTYTISNYVSGTFQFQSSGGGYSTTIRSANGVFVDVFSPTAAATLVAKAQTANSTFTVSNISVQEVTAATQAATSFKPKLVSEILGYTERYSLEFDGVDDVLFANTAIPFAQGLLLCVALSPQAVVTSGGAPQIYVSCRARSGSPSIGISQEYNAAGNKIVCQISDGSRSQWASLVHPPLSGWHVWTVLWANGRLQLRKNGVLVSDNSTAGILANGTIDFINVGSNRMSAPYNFANARIQAPVVASGITTLAEIQQIERAVAQAAGITL